MSSDVSLKEKVVHGTPKMPITGMHFEVGEGTMYSGRFFVDRHWHHKVEIIYVVKGSYEIEINLENYILKEGDICFLNSEDLHKIIGIEENTIHNVILFNPQILKFSYEDDFEENVVGPFVERKKIFSHIMSSGDVMYDKVREKVCNIMKKSITQQSDWYFSCKMCLLDLINYMKQNELLLLANKVLSAVDKQKVSRYKEIISYIEKNYAEPITLQELANIIPCNSQYLCRFFREITGVTPIQYLIQYRVERGCDMLVETTKSVLEISLDCGFDNVSYFIRQFKRLKGCTPKEYRRRY